MPPTEQIWFVARGNRELGSFTSPQLRVQVASGQIQPQDLLRLDGRSKWVTAASVKGLFPTVAEDADPTALGCASPASKPGVPTARIAGVNDPSLPRNQTVKESSPTRSRTPIWIGAGCCMLLALGLATWGLTKAESSWQKNDASATELDSHHGFTSSGTDLDDLVRLYSQDVVVASKEFRRSFGMAWIEAIMKLRCSSDPAVAAVVAATDNALILRAQAIGLDSEVTKENKERMKGLVQKNLPDVVHGMNWYSDSDIEHDVRYGYLTNDQADAYRKTRDEAQARGDQAGLNMLDPALQAYAHRSEAEAQISTLLALADRKEKEVFSQHLVPLLRARAGAKVDGSPLDLKAGPIKQVASGGGLLQGLGKELIADVERGPVRPVPRGPLGVACGSSQFNQELTRLTLLVEVKRDNRSRFVTAYIPRLASSEYFRLIPFACVFHDHKTKENARPPAAKVYYSVWCDQFTIENRELPTLADNAAAFAYAAGAAANTPYLCYPPMNEGGAYERAIADAEKKEAMLRRSSNQKVHASLPDPEKFCRYGLTFAYLKPINEGYGVQAQLDRYDPADKSKITSSVTYSGVMRPGPEEKPASTSLFVSPEEKRKRLEATIEENKRKRDEAKIEENKRKSDMQGMTREERKEAVQKNAQERKEALKKAELEKRDSDINRRLEYADLICELEAEGKRLLLHLVIQADGELRWKAEDPPLHNRNLISAEKVKKRDERLAAQERGRKP
jgi:GYF domain 2